MNSSTNAASSFFDGGSPAQLADADLLVATRLLIGRSNQLLAALLAHLAEVEARGIHRTRACSSLYTYCIYDLRLSEDEAYRRVAAARLVRRFPALLEAIATGALHLTGLLMLGPHLTEENLIEVLARAKHRTKKEIARLVRLLDPLPDVPPRIEPLGPAPARLVPEAPTWSEFVQSTCPVRELTPGDRPRDWMEKNVERANDFAQDGIDGDDSGWNEPAGPVAEAADEADPPARLAPQRYSVQFTVGEEYVKLVEEARALLSRSAPRPALDELHLRAVRALVAELKRQKYAVTTRPRKRAQVATPAATPSTEASQQAEENPATAESASEDVNTVPRQRGRYVPAHIRRTVFERDQARCTYTDSSGRRCSEAHRLELHHLVAFAQRGEHSESNLTLRCRAHNGLAAEEEFGRNFVEHQRDSEEHESWRRSQGGASGPAE